MNFKFFHVLMTLVPGRIIEENANLQRKTGRKKEIKQTKPKKGGFAYCLSDFGYENPSKNVFGRKI